jgi:stress-induced morphogen
MYVESKLFKGKSYVEMHQMVSSVLADEVKTMHGFNLKTKVPKDE